MSAPFLVSSDDGFGSLYSDNGESIADVAVVADLNAAFTWCRYRVRGADDIVDWRFVDEDPWADLTIEGTAPGCLYLMAYAAPGGADKDSYEVACFTIRALAPLGDAA